MKSKKTKNSKRPRKKVVKLVLYYASLVLIISGVALGFYFVKPKSSGKSSDPTKIYTQKDLEDKIAQAKKDWKPTEASCEKLTGSDREKLIKNICPAPEAPTVDTCVTAYQNWNDDQEKLFREGAGIKDSVISDPTVDTCVTAYGKWDENKEKLFREGAGIKDSVVLGPTVDTCATAYGKWNNEDERLFREKASITGANIDTCETAYKGWDDAIKTAFQTSIGIKGATPDECGTKAKSWNDENISTFSSKASGFMFFKKDKLPETCIADNFLSKTTVDNDYFLKSNTDQVCTSNPYDYIKKDECSADCSSEKSTVKSLRGGLYWSIGISIGFTITVVVLIYWKRRRRPP